VSYVLIGCATVEQSSWLSLVSLEEGIGHRHSFLSPGAPIFQPGAFVLFSKPAVQRLCFGEGFWELILSKCASNWVGTSVSFGGEL
jgi:hypothetical protein